MQQTPLQMTSHSISVAGQNWRDATPKTRIEEEDIMQIVYSIVIFDLVKNILIDSFGIVLEMNTLNIKLMELTIISGANYKLYLKQLTTEILLMQSL